LVGRRSCAPSGIAAPTAVQCGAARACAL